MAFDWVLAGLSRRGDTRERVTLPEEDDFCVPFGTAMS